MGSILRMVVGDGRFLDGVAPERRSQFLGRQVHESAPGLDLVDETALTKTAFAPSRISSRATADSRVLPVIHQ